MDKITRQQRKALELFFTQLAETLNDAGLDQRKVLKPSIQIPWDHNSVKNSLWREIQKAMFNIESTTELDKKQIDKIYEVLMRHLGEKFGVQQDFPSEENKYLNS